MMPASSNSLTVRYTVEIEILSSTATQRRYNSSTSGWSAASASTRAMTRRCSVMRMPVAAQRASIPEALSAGVDFSAVMCLALGNSASTANLERFQAKWKPVRVCATARGSRQVAAHQKGVQLFPAGLPVIALAAPGDGKSRPFVQPARRLIIFLDLQEHGAHAAAGEMAEMGQQEVAGQAAPAVARSDRDGKYFGLVRRHARYRKADDFASRLEPVHQRVALGQHDLEFAFAPAAVKRRAMQLRQTRRVAQGRGLDHRRAAAPQFGQPRHHGGPGCEAFCSASFGSLASGARR